LRPKTGQLQFGQLVWRKIFFFQFFLLDEWTTHFTSFPWTPSMSNSDSVEPVANSCWKRVLSSFFLYFLRSSYIQPCGWSCPRAEGQGAKKEVCFAHKILNFHFFSLFFCSCFCMMSPSIWPLWSKCEVFDFFQEILQGPQCSSFESRPRSRKIILAHS
jgi:hypothetical protein